MSHQFVDNFWEDDFTGIQGFEVLIKRLKDGKKMTQDLEEYLKARAKIEDMYAREMQKLARNHTHWETGTGSLKASWESLKNETDASSREHLAVSQRMTMELEKSCKDFKEKQRETKRKVEDTVKKSQLAKKTAYLHEGKLKQDYFNKCKLAEKAEEVASKGAGLPPKKQEELKMKAKRAQATVEAADLLYKEAVATLDENRVLWEREMEIACMVFQELEEERISFMRNLMWRFCNVCSSMAVQEDEMYESVRLSLEKCDVTEDLNEFVEQKRTGSDRPASVEYQHYSLRNRSSFSKLQTGGSTASFNRTLPNPPLSPTESGSHTWSRAPACLPLTPSPNDDQYSVVAENA